MSRLSADEVRRRFSAIRTWSRRGERAPNKPLLVLMALGRVLNGKTRLAPFSEFDRPLASLLREFGPNRRLVHPEYPFWRLQRDQVWEVTSSAPLKARKGSNDPRRTELLREDVRGGFSEAIDSYLRVHPAVAADIATDVLETHFPTSVHEDFRSAAGLPHGDLSPTREALRARDSRFRTEVLKAYERRCAVCGFDLRLSDAPVGLDAAHIMWFQVGGPDLVTNGLALCTLHHKLFDRGAWTLDNKRRILLSDELTGGERFQSLLLSFHGATLRLPQSRVQLPDPKYIEWHRYQVFHGTPRKPK